MKKNAPNIIFLHVDQMQANLLKACGGYTEHAQYLNTPGMDAIAAEGHSFARNYASNPVCCPSRTCWYTGRASTEHGTVRNEFRMRENPPDLGQWLTAKTDYLSVYTGKWHVDRDIKKSFQCLDLGTALGEYSDGATARAAMSFIKNHDGAQPFFLSIGLMNPHDCCYTYGAAGGLGKYGLGKKLAAGDYPIKLPPLPDNFKLRHGEASARQPTSEIDADNFDETDWRYYIYQYHRQTEMVDATILRIWQTLKASPFADNTLLIFSSDHGEGGGYKGRKGKGLFDDNMWRTPLIFSFPGRIKAGVTDYDTVTDGLDIPATICDYAGCAPMPEMNHPRSLRGVLERGEAFGRDYAVGETTMQRPGAAIRSGPYKTEFYADNDVAAIYNLETDPLETQELSGTAEGQRVLAKHLGYLREYISQITPTRKTPQIRPNAREVETYEDFPAQLLNMYDRVKAGSIDFKPSTQG